MLRIIAQYAVLVLLSASVIAALVRVWPPIADWIERRDTFLVVPDWRFFAPTPNRSDYHIVVRKRRAAVSSSSWSAFRSSMRTSLRPRILDPDRRLRKALVDVAAHYVALATHRRHQAAEELRPTISTSMVYLLLLSAASVGVPADVEVQFGIIATRHDPFDPGEIIVLSDFHPASS